MLDGVLGRVEIENGEDLRIGHRGMVEHTGHNEGEATDPLIEFFKLSRFVWFVNG